MLPRGTSTAAMRDQTCERFPSRIESCHVSMGQRLTYGLSLARREKVDVTRGPDFEVKRSEFRLHESQRIDNPHHRSRPSASPIRAIRRQTRQPS